IHISPGTIKLYLPSDKNGDEIDKVLQEERVLIMVGDEKPKDGIANMEKRVKAEID
ncbi:sugar ABC transporter substrate-binding protein, partial [Enterococcus mundtii]|nr:sugar ABC transporter substrate-binding protein [Enterococcus mundtii]